MSLPETFIEEMALVWKQMSPPGTFAEFLAAMEKPSMRGLRSNGLKLSAGRLIEMLGEIIDSEVLWSDDGFYLKNDVSPGKSAAYHAGLFYIQEPSAMLPAMISGARPGEKILDLCAAPGGKTVKMAADLQGEGLLWANEISADRAKALLRNVELTGCRNCVITQETPERLAERLPLYFDKILVDAPCSGSGMFRRDSNAAASWERYGPAQCVLIQRDILESADKMLRAGGYIIYSTCSFSVSEDEQMVTGFLAAHPDYEIVEIDAVSGLSHGLNIKHGAKEAENDLPEYSDLTKTARIWPHQAAGDGHYCAMIRKKPEAESAESDVEAGNVLTAVRSRSGTRNQELDLQTAEDLWQQWSEACLSVKGRLYFENLMPEWKFRLHKDRLHLMPKSVHVFPDIRFVKTGLFLGSFRQHHSAARNNIWKFEPSHSLFLSLQAADFKFTLRYRLDDSRLQRYLKGETLVLQDQDWTGQGDLPSAGDTIVICLEEFPVGQARLMPGNMLKNLYPPAWRKLL